MNPLETRNTLGRASLLLALVIVVALFPSFALANVNGPAWWYQPHGGIASPVRTTGTASSYSVVNQGQLKNIATAAYLELEAKLPCGAGADLENLINKWSVVPTSGTGPRIAISGSSTKDYAVVNIGQLKAVAKLFYDQLIHVGYTTQYPWTTSTNAANDYALANIGQVKNLFSFDLTGFSWTSESLPDWWKMNFFATLDVDPNADPDGDGFTNLQEYHRGTSPADANLNVTLVGASATFNSSPCTLVAHVSQLNNVQLTSLKLNGASIEIQTGDFQLDASLVEGRNIFTLVATDQEGHTGQATATVILDTSAPLVAITQPQTGSSFSTSRIDVHGTVTDSSMDSVLVNGVTAFVANGKFDALSVPIVPGQNVITATAKDSAGNVSTTSILVTGSDVLSDPISLQASVTTGFAPLTVTFHVPENVPGTIQEVSYDFVGDHVSFTTKPDLQPVTHTYSDAGEYYPVVTIKTTVGSFSSYGGFNAGKSQPRLTIRVNVPPQIINLNNIADPIDLALGQNGSLYVLSRSTAAVMQFSSGGQLIRSLANIGATPCGLDVDSYGNVYVALTGNNQVIRLKPTETAFELDTTFHQTGTIGNADGTAGSGSGVFNAPYDVAVGSDAIYVSDKNNHRIQKFSLDGSFVRSMGSQGAALGQLNNPKGLRFGQGGYLYVVDAGNNRVAMISADGFTDVQGSAGSAPAQFQSPLNLDSDSEAVYVADTGNNRVQALDPGFIGGDGEQKPVFAPLWSVSSEIGLNGPSAVASSHDLVETKLHIADTGNNRVICVKIPRGDSPEIVWNQMKQQMAAKNIEYATLCFADEKRNDYREFFNQIGKDYSAQIVGEIGQITPICNNGSAAQYRFEKDIDGTMVSFNIHFVRENGHWKILEF